jgi:hypothetical protein
MDSPDGAPRRRKKRRGGVRAFLDRLPGFSGYVVTVGGAVSVLYAGWSYFEHVVRPDRCSTLAEVNWAGWECNPPVAKVMVGGCEDTREVSWLNGELHKLVSAGYVQSPYPAFKLVPGELVEGHIKSLWFCQDSEADIDCVNRQKNKQQWFSVWVGDRTSVGQAITIVGNSPGYTSGRVYLDKDGATWCALTGSQLKQVELPSTQRWFGCAR